MAQVTLPFNLTPGSPENVNNLMDNLRALRDGVNTIDTAQLANGSVTAAKLGPDVTTGADTLNVKNYGAKGDGTSDDTSFIQTAIDACPEGGSVVFPKGVYRISSPLYGRRNVTLRGVHAPRWPYRTGTPSVIRALSTFSGAALFHVRSYAAAGTAAPTPADGTPDLGSVENDGGAVEQLCFDGQNKAGVYGIYIHGECRSWRFTNVTIRKTGDTGFRTAPYSTGSGTETVRGLTMDHVVVDRAGNNGFSFNQSNDCHFNDLLAVGCTNNGFYCGIPGENAWVECRAVFNGGDGFFFSGASFGGTFTGCHTDRNDKNGIVIECSGTRPLVFSSLQLRRDGRNNKAGGSNYAAIHINGATCPVILRGVATMPGVDDDGTGTNSPQWGLRCANATSVTADGFLWGNTGPVKDEGGNGRLELSRTMGMAAGSTSSPAQWTRAATDEAYAATITPNPLKGELYKIGDLTGNITVNAPTEGAYEGAVLGFWFKQDSTGGRTITFNAAYKTSWTPITTASTRSFIEFVYDGANWVQTTAQTGL